MNNILSMHDIVKVYYMDDEYLGELKHIDFLAGEMESVLILGPSESGKQPMTNIIGCLDVPADEHRMDSGDGFSLGTGRIFGWDPAQIPATSTSLTHCEAFKKVSE